MANIKVTNASNRELIIPDQQSLPPGASAVTDDGALNHPVFAGWVESGWVTLDDAPADDEPKRSVRKAKAADSGEA